MSETKKPRICAVMGVEVDELFEIEGWAKGCFVGPDGELCSETESIGQGAVEWAINHPEAIKRKRRWTAEDIEDAKAIRRIWPDAEVVSRSKTGQISVRITKSRERYAIWLTGQGNIFGSLQPGETVTLDEILEAEHG